MFGKFYMHAVRFLAAVCSVSFALQAGDEIYRTERTVMLTNDFDRALEDRWKECGLFPVYEASDCVLVRRLYIDLVGRLPSPGEARAFVSSADPGKYPKLVDKLLGSPEFTIYWSMKFGDMLRVKSEFPINLWPNAVYAYMRRIQEFLAYDEPYDRFIRELLTARGSNFRNGAVNFHRAHADRSTRGIAKETFGDLFDQEFGALPEREQKAWEAIFAEVGFKSTLEWKEEIVFRKQLPSREIMLPDHRFSTVPEGGSALGLLAESLGERPGKQLLARALANRTWRWFFGADLAGENDPALESLTDGWIRRDLKFRALCRAIVTSAAYRSASFQADAKNKADHFAAYPVRRREAEVLDDAIGDITGWRNRYSSVIPEPFTFIPREMRTTAIADGSISSSFLILFGRPSRDAGTPGERADRINAKQRLFLFNSGELFRKLQNVPRRGDLRRLPVEKRIDGFYWLFYSRPPTGEERAVMLDYLRKIGKGETAERDILWTLVNSAEFLHRH